MRITVLIIALASTLFSCRSGLYTINESYLDSNEINIKTFNFDEFDIYVYNMCEQISQETNNDRFSYCPDNFFEITSIDSIQKVEELYLLKHKKTDLILYLTTFSHKYIKLNEGFLNERKYYENKIVLDQIENIYIGQVNAKNGLIFFSNPKTTQDIILHYDKKTFPSNITLIKANISTAENGYNTSEPIELTGVFKQNIKYVLKSYGVDFYKKISQIGKVKVKELSHIHIVSKGGKIEIAFSFKNNNILYKMASKRIKYHPNFYLLP